MKKNSFCLLVILSVLIPSGIYAQQNPVDSLLNEIEKTSVDTSKVYLLNELANMLKGRNNEEAMKYAQEAIKIAEDADYKTGIADVYKTMGIIYFMFGDFEKAYESTNKSRETYESIDLRKGVAACYVNVGIFKKTAGEIKESGENFRLAIDIYKEIDDKEGIARTYLNLGNLFRMQGDFKSSLDNYYQSLKFFEEVDDNYMVALLYQNIATVYADLEDTEKALENYDKALEYFVELNDLNGIADVKSNIAYFYYEDKEYDLAIDNFLESLKLFEEIGYTSRVANTLYNLGDLYIEIKEYDLAMEYLDKSLEIYEGMNFSPGKALCYSGYGEYYYQQGNYFKAINFLEEAKEIHYETDIYHFKETVEWLSKTYKKMGDFEKAYENHVIFKQINDSIFNENNEKAITALSMQYEFDKKEKIREVEEQKKEAVQKEKDKWDFIVKSGLSLLVLLMLVIAVISIFNYRRKVKANKLLRAQKEEIEFQKIELEQRNEEIEAQRDEIEDKNVLITDQRDIAIKQKQEITDSIQYAQRIQEAVLPDKQMFVNFVDDYFIYFRPKDIVSGDFYWMTQVDGKLIVTAADCTGHGVPGAFMSLLGLTFLNEIVNKDKILQANEILNRLRIKVIDSLHQKDRESKDGIDMAISIIDIEKQEIQYAGAYNPLYLIPANEEGKYEINKIPADRMPIGIHLKMEKNFTNQIIKYNKGDKIYMFSDGYMDQFGGDDGRKLKSRQFQKLLLDIQTKPMGEQKTILDNFLRDWKGNLDQLDDIIIIGIKL